MNMNKSTVSNMPSEMRPWSGALEFKALAETLPSLVFAADAHGHNVYVNASFQRYTGVSVTALLGGGWLSIIHPEDQAQASMAWKANWSDGEPSDTRYRFRRFDGEYRWHLVRGAPIRGAQGEVLRWIGSCTDVDDLVASIANRSQSAAILDGLGNIQNLVLYAKDADGRFVYANDATLQVIGLGVDQVLGQRAESFSVTESDAVAIRKNDDLAMQTGSPVTVEESWIDADGVTRVFRSFKTPMHLPDGRAGIAAASVDVTLEHNLARALDQKLVRHRQQLDSLPIVIWEADAQGSLIAVNQQWRECVGFPSDQFSFADLLCEEAVGPFLSQWQFCIDASEILDYATRISDNIATEGRDVQALAFPVHSSTEAKAVDRWFGCFL
jgi:PAS domain S-box-containing protein